MFVPLSFDQSFRPYLQELARFENTKDLETSALYRKLKPDFERVLSHVGDEELVTDAYAPTAGRAVKAVAWNIERGICTDAICRLLQDHRDLRDPDVLLLSELDWGMARTENRFVVRDIAAALNMNYAFAPCYVALTKGAGVEKHVAGENEESLHGNALLRGFR